MTRAIQVTPRLRAALDAIPAFVLVLEGPDLTVTLASPRAGSAVSSDAVIGWPVERLLAFALSDPGDRAHQLAMLRQVLETGEPVIAPESRIAFAGRDGATWWDVAVVPLRAEPGAPPDGVCLHAVDVTRLVAARGRAEEAERRYRTLSDSRLLGIAVADGERWLEANDAWLSIIGRSWEDLEAGLDWTDLMAPDHIEAGREAIARFFATGQVPPFETVFLRPDGTRVPVLLGTSMLSEDPLRILGTSVELTEVKAAEAAAAALLQRTRRLQEVTATVSAAGSTETIARAVVHTGLEELSASAGVLVRGVGDGVVEHAAGFGSDDVARWRDFPATIPLELTSGAGVAVPAGEVMPGGRVLSLPLEGRGGERLGSVALAFRDAGRELDAGERDFLLTLLRQAGLALDRIRLYEDRAYVARKLQEGLLPKRLAQAPGLEAAVVYESISGGGEVGGDFYDLFASGPERWTATVGDVCGKGTEAAVITGLARHTVRAVAQTTGSPAELLAFLNTALCTEGDEANFLTIACAAITPDGNGGWTATVSSGGHPFPLVLRADGTLEEVEVIGTMLGVTATPDLVEHVVHLAPGDALVLHTDGVTDARPLGGERFGEERLLAAVRGAAGADADGIAQAVEGAVRAHLPGPSADDRAIMVLRAAPSSG